MSNENKDKSNQVFPLVRSYRSNAQLESIIRELVNTHGYTDKSHVVRSAIMILDKIRREMELEKSTSLSTFISKTFLK
jgi:Arc/MetJ-type ribon-helix-helix transcriptional regulator